MTLSVAIARLNSRIRSRGLSAREMWTQRDQFSNSQIPLVDRDLIMTQHKTRVLNHPYSELSKAPLSKRVTDTALTVGDLVYLHTDRNKSCARHRYLATSVDGNWCNVRKFVGAQLRSSSYRVKFSECYKVAACSTDLSRNSPRIADEILSGDEEEIVLPLSRPPCT